MTPLDLSTLLAGLRQDGGDSSGVEVKSALGGLPSTIGQSICALANRPGGGVVVLGLDERADFTTVGLEDLQALKQGLASRARMCEPPVVLEIEQAMVDGEPIVLARVAECAASAKPCRFQGRGWLRAWDGDYSMSQLEEQAFLRLRDVPRADRLAVPGTSRVDLDAHLVAIWLATAREMDGVGLGRFSDDEECLIRGGVLTGEGEVTKAGLLTLGIHPQQYFPRFVLNLAASDGQTRTRAVEPVALSGPIPVMLEGALTWARTVLRRSVVDFPDGRVRDAWEYPLEAIRELVANALVHRDLDSWSEGLAVEVRLLPDRFVITNPGGLYGITVDRLGAVQTTSARNGRLLEICRYARASDDVRVVETLASGIPRIISSLREAALPAPSFIDTGIAFTVVLRRTPPHVSPAAFSATQRRILVELAAGPLQVAELELRTAIRPATLRKALRVLAAANRVVQRGGRGQATTYELINE